MKNVSLAFLLLVGCGVANNSFVTSRVVDVQVADDPTHVKKHQVSIKLEDKTVRLREKAEKIEWRVPNVPDAERVLVRLRDERGQLIPGAAPCSVKNKNFWNCSAGPFSLAKGETEKRYDYDLVIVDEDGGESLADPVIIIVRDP